MVSPVRSRKRIVAAIYQCSSTDTTPNRVLVSFTNNMTVVSADQTHRPVSPAAPLRRSHMKSRAQHSLRMHIGPDNRRMFADPNPSPEAVLYDANCCEETDWLSCRSKAEVRLAASPGKRLPKLPLLHRA